MAEYIERENVEKMLDQLYDGHGEKWCNAIDAAIMDLTDIPAADVRPERHGRWVDYKHNTSAIQCTACEHIFESAIFGYAYCPICGAKMDGEEKNGN